MYISTIWFISMIWYMYIGKTWHYSSMIRYLVLNSCDWWLLQTKVLCRLKSKNDMDQIYKTNINEIRSSYWKIYFQLKSNQNLYCINNHHVLNTTEAILTMWATVHYTTRSSWEASLTTNTKQNKTHLYLDTRMHVYVRVWTYTHISKRTHTCIHVYIYIYTYMHIYTHDSRHEGVPILPSPFAVQS